VLICVERRSKTENTGFLARFIADSEQEAKNVLLSTHRGAITWYLSKKLSEASDIQRNQQEVRLMREVEKSKRYRSFHKRQVLITVWSLDRHQSSKGRRTVRQSHGTKKSKQKNNLNRRYQQSNYKSLNRKIIPCWKDLNELLIR
jgi:hypothetical protein